MVNDPASYHINTLLNNERYDTGLDENELEVVESTADEMLYALDGTSASVVDDFADRDGTYENSAAFMSKAFEQQPDVEKIQSPEGSHGFVAAYKHRDQEEAMTQGPVTLARMPMEVALVFDVAGKDQYDIKIE